MGRTRVKSVNYGADFETIVSTERTRVWLWGLRDFNSEEVQTGTDIDDFMEQISKFKATVYFHNLKFDIQFIFYWLFTHGYKFTTERYPDPGYFTALISSMSVYYSACIGFKNGVTVTLIDSLKIIPLPIRDIPKAFGLLLKKLDLDYEGERDINHQPTAEEIEYIKADVNILVEGVKHVRAMGLQKMTAPSNALQDFKARVGKDDFKVLFPALTKLEDRDLRLSYKGGWTYLNPKFAGQIVGPGKVYDVNSMYPWAMMSCILPYGPPEFYRGQYVQDDYMPLYIQCLACKFKLKPGKYPSIQLKGNMRFSDVEYITDSSDEAQVLTLTSVDLKLFFDLYDVWDIEWICGYKLAAKTGIFEDYINTWYNTKSEAKKSNNPALATIAKLMLNSLYGKFGTNPNKQSKYPYFDEENDIVRYSNGPETFEAGGYVPMAAFITSYCRDKIIRAANSCGEHFIYADTDSIHIMAECEPDIDIDEYRLGAFKLESEFETAKFHRPKCYIEIIEGVENKKCAGLPVSARGKFTMETMQAGSQFDGKLAPKIVPGGVTLVDRKFSIK